MRGRQLTPDAIQGAAPLDRGVSTTPRSHLLEDRFVEPSGRGMAEQMKAHQTASDDTQPIGRVCNRRGCGKPILDKAGRPVFNRNFCGAECRQADKRERLQDRRQRARTGRCAACGRKAVAVSSSDSRVPRHNVPPSVKLRAVGTEGQTTEKDSVNRL